MKKIITTTIFLFTFNIFSQMNIGNIFYSVSYDQNHIEKYWSKDRFNIKNEMTLQTSDKINKKGLSITSILSFNKTESIYKIKDNISIKEDIGVQIMKTRAGGDETNYYNQISNLSLTKDCYLLDECFLIEETPKNWQLLEEKELISGYICKKAALTEVLRGKTINIKAWYAPSIPFNYGPRGYNGLSGMILKLVINDKIIFTAKKIELNKKPKIKIKKPNNAEYITANKFDVFLKKAYPSFFN